MSSDPPPSKPAGSPSEQEPLMDRRTRPDRRRGERRRREEAVPKERRSGSDRRKVQRRRTAGPHEMTAEEMEFIQAVDRFKAQTGKRFPSAREILHILRELGYEKGA